MRAITLFTVLFLASMQCMSQNLAKAGNPQGATPKTTYLVIYSQGPGWLVGKPIKEQPLKEHGRYWLGLYVKGVMKLAGPFTDNAGGAVLFTAADMVEAKAIIANDPAVKSKVFVYELHPWKLQPWDEFAKKFKGAAQQGASADRHPATRAAGG